MNGRMLLLLCLLVGILTVAGWLHHLDDTPAPDKTESPRGYYLTDARITQTDTTGQIRYALEANRIEQDLASDRIHLMALTLVFRDQSAEAWQLRARSGWLDNHSQQAAFAGEVTIQPGDDANTYLLTDSLNVDLATQIARTRDAVTLRMNQQQITAQGLFADIKTRKLKLESQVRGAFTLSNQLGLGKPSATPSP